jgi:hypothetical protein
MDRDTSKLDTDKRRKIRALTPPALSFLDHAQSNALTSVIGSEADAGGLAQYLGSAQFSPFCRCSLQLGSLRSPPVPG